MRRTRRARPTWRWRCCRRARGGADEVLKRRLYERTGIGEYRVVDPEIDIVKVYRLSGAAYGRPVELALERGDTLTSPLFPDLAFALADVFAPA